jgi:hypothetical protein
VEDTSHYGDATIECFGSPPATGRSRQPRRDERTALHEDSAAARRQTDRAASAG